jgi:hypothetical protein
MKRVLLIKTSNEIQLAHLYEHLYLMAVVEFFKAHGLFDYLDYWFSGKTYHGGFIYLNIHLYSPAAEQLAGELSGLNPSFEQEAIEGAAVQIVAEKQHRLGGDLELLEVALADLHNQPWQTMNELTLLDARRRRSRKVLWDTDAKVRTKEMRCELVLDTEFARRRKDLLPLFDVVAHVLLDNLANELTDSYYYHMIGTASTYTKQVAKRTHTFRGWLQSVPTLTDELEACKLYVADMVRRGVAGRIAHFLQTSDYEAGEAVSTIPDELRLYEATGILVGAAGWHQIATESNIADILRRTSLQLTYGRERQQARLADQPLAALAA